MLDLVTSPLTAPRTLRFSLVAQMGTYSESQVNVVNYRKSPGRHWMRLEVLTGTIPLLEPNPHLS